MSKYTAYTRLRLNNMPSRHFVSTLPPVEVDFEEVCEKIQKVSREKFTKKRELVEDKIKRWSEGTEKVEGVAPKKLEGWKKEKPGKDDSRGKK